MIIEFNFHKRVANLGLKWFQIWKYFSNKVLNYRVTFFSSIHELLFLVDCIVIVMYSEIIFDIIVLIIVAEGLPAPTISWLVNGSQIGRQVMDKNFKIRGLRSQSELFVLPSSDRWYCTIPAKKEQSILHIHFHSLGFSLPAKQKWIFIKYVLFQILHEIWLCCWEWSWVRDCDTGAEEGGQTWSSEAGGDGEGDRDHDQVQVRASQEHGGTAADILRGGVQRSETRLERRQEEVLVSRKWWKLWTWQSKALDIISNKVEGKFSLSWEV